MANDIEVFVNTGEWNLEFTDVTETVIGDFVDLLYFVVYISTHIFRSGASPHNVRARLLALMDWSNLRGRSTITGMIGILRKGWRYTSKIRLPSLFLCLPCPDSYIGLHRAGTQCICYVEIASRVCAVHTCYHVAARPSTKITTLFPTSAPLISPSLSDLWPTNRRLTSDNSIR